ncbi:hypothetical protein ABZR86_08215 [Dyella marensis]|uniref:hypothetical protein n=1 Tax=Dyella TaxID=231454 RepID=UPI001160C244|nr:MULTISPECIES: hypothetical protein [Dyella]
MRAAPDEFRPWMFGAGSAGACAQFLAACGAASLGAEDVGFVTAGMTGLGLPGVKLGEKALFQASPH